ncbi:MAG: radical SAM protein [Candidatus Bathyarchaeia archaeon]|nr:radical SAM protein [Candidatus Bathyarchaeia archaeon]
MKKLGIGIKLLQLLLRQKLTGKGLKGEPLTPQIVSFAVTKACNLLCLHCHADAREPFANELTLKEGLQTIDELAMLGTEALIFSGGEPLLRKQFVLSLAEHCIDAGIIPAMLTNGVLIDHKVALQLKDAGIMAVGIPIDSIDPKIHDRLRNVPGTFDKALRGIRACNDVDLKVVVTTMALRSNYAKVPQMIDFISSLGVDQVAIYDLVPNGRGKEMMQEIMLQEQRESLMLYLQRIQEEKEMIFVFSGGNPLYPQIAATIHKTKGTSPPNLLLKQFWINAPVGCHAGINYLSLRPNGDVYPCPFLQIKVGNIREKSITEMWHSSKLLKTLRNRSLLVGKCGDCEYREPCGGCRGRAYAYSGDFLAEDPVCLRDLMIEENIFPAKVECFGWCVG